MSAQTVKFKAKVNHELKFTDISPLRENVIFQVRSDANPHEQTLDIIFNNEKSRFFGYLVQDRDCSKLAPGSKIQPQTVAIANSTLEFRVDLPDLKNTPMFFGNLDKHELAGHAIDLDGKRVQIILKDEKVTKSSIVFYHNQQYLGTLTEESVALLTEKNNLRLGKTFELKAVTKGSGFSTYTILTSSLGNFLTIFRQNSSATRFQGEIIKVTLNEKKQESICTFVYLNIDGKIFRAGKFTTSQKSKQTVELLKKAQLFGNEKSFYAYTYCPPLILEIEGALVNDR